ncbi:methyl-accepting chemotaxis protein [Planktothricoides raciborskii]|uniref:Methyl-accepting chemotaxis protein n=1 Tax=Planktothricoides raciborskii FACHB-1370 TaxID=2949576 RepID=A0ABR8EGW8_9CYAN|nr:methyl-accepting chemotaxis protein [Planktothricoides raciborskii]MBD2545735.1 methyl-accepting chemotaxis protein [Planktothricoides raciborskii FACHB-1370]MBD2582694.1 methyl-accepting chemotaxis protein [Planktothricoides raciborskii FACHB-1261]
MSFSAFLHFHLFDSQKLKYRILSVYFMPIILFGIASFIVYKNGVNISISKEKFTLAHQSLNDVKRLGFSLTLMQRSALGYMIGQDPVDIKTFERWDDLFYQQSEILRSTIVEPRQKELLNKIITLGYESGEFDRRLISYIELGNPNKAIETWNQGNRQQIIHQLEQLLADFEAIIQEELQIQSNQADVALKSLPWAVFGSTCLVAVVAIALGLRLAGAIADRMNQEATAVAGSALEIAATIEEQARTSSLQASSVHETTTTIDELNASARKMSEQAESSARSARVILELTTKGSHAIEQSLEDMSLLQQKVGAIAEQIQELNQQASQIRQIISLVSDFASQTNMLALNASVEAVRAGEQGKGFGVVANYIRQLADQSRASSQQIDELITEIQSKIQATVSVSQEGQKIVATSVQISENTAAAFTQVRNSMNEMALNSQQISLGAVQQTQAIEQIVQAMQNLNIAAKESAEGIIQVQISTQQLSHSAENLQKMI